MTIKLDELLRNANEIMADNTLSDYQKSVALAAIVYHQTKSTSTCKVLRNPPEHFVI